MSKEARLWGWAHWQTWAVLLAFCLTAVWFYQLVLSPSANELTHGFGAYYSASRLLAEGEISAEIYDPAYFLPIVREDSLAQAEDIFNANPPTTTFLFLPLAPLSIEQARQVWTFANVGLLVGGIVLLFWGFGFPFGDPREWYVVLLAVSFGLLFRPVIQNFRFGQAYVLVFFLMSAATAAFFKSYDVKRTRSEAVGGLALMLAMALKTAGWPLLILLAWLRKGRYLVWAVGSGLVVLLVTLPIFPLEMWLAYGRLLSQFSRSPLICVPAYQTTRSWLCHLFAPEVNWYGAEAAGIGIPAGVTIVYVTVAIICLVALLRLGRKRPRMAFIGFVCLSVLILPLGEVHHHTPALIAFVWFMVRWRRQSWVSRLLVVAAAYFYLIKFPVNAPEYQTGAAGLWAYPYLAGAWLIFMGILWDHRRGNRADSGSRQ